MVNALRDIETAREIEIRLQSNEVLVHLPSDTPISAVSDAIYEAGFTPDETVRLQAEGQWSQKGFVPSGWTEPIAAGSLPIVRREMSGIWFSSKLTGPGSSPR